MPARRLAALVVLAVLPTFALLGPRVNVTPPPAGLPRLAQDPEAELGARESAITGLRADAQARIVWAGRPGARSTVSVVYLHGYSASPRELSPLPEQIARSLRANLFLARLRGHGRDGEALAAARAGEWLDDALHAYAIGARLGERVIVIGNSTGATLATWLALRPEAERLAAVVLLSPNFGPRDARARMLLWPWARYYAPWVAGPTYSFEPVNAAHAHYWTTRYPTIALVEMMALVDHVRDAPLEQLRVPALVLYDPRDRIVDAGRIEATAARLGRNTGKKPARLLALQNTQDPQRHVLAGDVLSPNTTDTVAAQILDFLRGVLGSGRGEAQDQHDHSDHEQDE